MEMSITGSLPKYRKEILQRHLLRELFRKKYVLGTAHYVIENKIFCYSLRLIFYVLSRSFSAHKCTNQSATVLQQQII